MPRRLLVVSLLAAFVAVFAANPLMAARELTSLFGGGAPKIRYELVVFERERCAYCEVFKERIAPQYREGTHAKTMPLRFVDIDQADIEHVGLKSRLTVLPTAVVMKDGIEVDRVPGLTAPSTFFTLIQHILSKAE